MANIQITIKNLPQIRAAFSQAPIKMAVALNKAIRRTIFSIQADSMRNTPVDTGRLRASHQTLFTNLRGELSPTANYAFFVHDGTRFMRGRPFLLQAVRSKEKETDDNFTDAVQGVLDDIARSSS